VPILLVLLLAPDAVLWRFQGPQADALREAAVAAQQAGGLAGHLLSEAALEAHLASVDPAGARQPELLGCLADRQVCPDPARAVLALVGLSGRINADLSRSDSGYTATLVLTPADPTAQPRTWTGRGDTAAVAVADVLEDLEGQASLEVEVVPGDARLFLDDAPLGTGSGRYPVSPGLHTVRAEIDGMMPLSQTVEVAAGGVVELRFELGSDYGQLILKLSPEEARATLNGRAAGPTQDLAPGEYQLRVEAPGHQSHEQTVSIKSATALTITVGLPREVDDSLRRFESPHPDTLANPFTVRADLRFVTVGSGPLDVSRAVEGGGKVEYDTLDDSVGLLGLGITAGWQGRYLLVDALTLTYEGGGGETKATLASGEADRITGLSRVTVRPGQVGVRYPSWRFSPFITGGIQFIFDSIEVTNEAGGAETLDKASLMLGFNGGVEVHLAPDWSGRLAGGLDFGFESRTTFTFVVGAGYLFDLDGLF
jgi:hypothetical protein